MKKQKGFTLIELMIVVAVIAIISMIAVPSYQNAQRKARISEGISNLTSIQSQIEKYRLQNRKMYSSITLENILPNGSTIEYSGKPIYNVAYQAYSDANNPADRAKKYQLTATATGNWLPLNDPCRILNLDGLGILDKKNECQK